MRADQVGANVSCLANLPLQETVRQIRQLGFRGITLLAFPGTRHSYGELPGFWFHEMSDEERRELKRLVADFERIAVHAPFADLPLFSYDRRVEQLSLDRVKEAIDAAGYLGANVVIVHTNPRPNLPIELYWSDVVGTFRLLGEYAVEKGTSIGVETGYPDKIEQFVDLLEAIGHYRVGATLDTGHLARYVERPLWRTTAGAAQLNQRLIDMARQLGPLTIHCQLHDVRLTDWRDHLALGSGVIDFQAFLAELRLLGYEGMLELELEEKDQLKALKRSKCHLEGIIRRLEAARPENRCHAA